MFLNLEVTTPHCVIWNLKTFFQLLFLFHFNEYKMQHMKISELAHLYLRLQSRKKISL